MVGEKRLWKLDQGLCVLLMLLIPLQLCLSIANLFYGIDKGYGHSFPLWSYVLSAAYLCVVLSADGFMICVGRLELSKFVGRLCSCWHTRLSWCWFHCWKRWGSERYLR